MALASAFKLFGVSHLVVLALTLLLPAILIIIARKANSSRFTKMLCWAMAAVLLANEAGYYVRGFQTRTWIGFVQSSLPLHLCGIALYMTVIALVTRRQIIFELACFWGLVGTPQALLTPTVEFDFPNWWFWQFFICHCGIVAGVAFAIGALKMRPRRGSMWRVFAITNVCLAAIAVFDYLTGANYMYLCAVPEVNSPLVAFGWPWHILIAYVGILVGFGIVELLLARKAPAAQS
ncbi:MAG: TIGR02206 family membrane protein [Planctomycetes bacterium]|nr:TIGR02206 family membrane protein [Planctomycetota bacterium]